MERYGDVVMESLESLPSDDYKPKSRRAYCYGLLVDIGRASRTLLLVLARLGKEDTTSDHRGAPR